MAEQMVDEIPTFRQCIERHCDCTLTFFEGLMAKGLTEQQAKERLLSCDGAADAFDLLDEP